MADPLECLDWLLTHCALAAYDVRVIREDWEIERHIRRWQKLKKTKFKRASRSSGKRETVLMSSSFSKFDVLSPFLYKRNLPPPTRQTLHDVICLLPFCTLYMVCHENVMWCAWWSGFSCHCFHKPPLLKLLRRFFGQIKIEIVSQVSFPTIPWGIMLCTIPI